MTRYLTALVPFFALAASAPAWATTFNVCSSCTYTTINAAITAASNGDTINVAGGTYNEQLNVTKQLTFVGAGSSTTTIAYNSGTAVKLNPGSGHPAAMSGFTINAKSGSTHALELPNGNYTLSDLQFSAFTGSNNGAAIWAHGTSNVTLSSSTIDNADTSANGGAIYGEQNTNLTLTDVTIKNCGAAYGGGIYFNGASSSYTLTINGGAFTSNSGTSGYGGAIYVQAGTLSIGSTSGATFTSNSAIYYGGAIYAAASAAGTIANSTFSSNTSSSGYGGAIDWTTNNLTLTSDTFTSNSAYYQGGAVYFAPSSTLTVNGGSFTSNASSSERGGAIYVSSGTLSVGATSGTTFSKNTSGYHAGAIYVYASTNTTIANSTFDQNSCPYYGGAVFQNAGTLTLTSDTFTSNQSTSSTSYGGGAVYSNVAVTVTGGTFSNNTSAWHGGAIYVYAANLTVSNATFTSNTATGGEGGAFRDYYSGALSVTGSTFTSNKGTNGGGVSFVGSGSTATVTLTTDTFTSNSATSGNGGGASIDTAGTLTLTDDTFTGGSATVYSGGLYAATVSTLAATRNTFCSNTATNGAGALVYAGSAGTSSHVWKNNVFLENTASVTGGGLYLWSAPATITNNDFVGDKSAASSGGALYTDSAIQFENNVVAYTKGGDGIRTGLTSGTGTTIDYNDFYSNTSSNISGTYTTLGSGNLTSTDPAFFSYTSTSACSSNLRYPSTSGLVNKGDPSSTYNDPDGSRNDIGAYGGGGASSTTWTDADGDGVKSVYDCNDADSAIYPGATEICDLKDNDCDGSTDEGVLSTFYRDADGDGYGTTSTTTTGCTAPSGYTADSTDCNDGSSAVHPGATETCNAVDDDCDSSIDEGVTSTFYRDADGDGHGTTATTTTGCSAPSGYVASSDDCDDTKSTVYTGATETCNTVDDDCDGSIDEGVTSTFYKDADGDGYGTSSATKTGCTAPSGYVASSTDCDDASSSVHPGATEYCNSKDDDCDGSTDESDAADASTWYADTDGDGYGNALATSKSCSKPSGYVADATDCGDSSASVHPGAAEKCDAIDEDCNGTLDDDYATDASTWYEDDDADGYGTSVTKKACSLPSGYAASTGDCDDTAKAVNPGADEVCNTIDDDCDGAVDEADAADTASWYADKDADGYGDPSSTPTVACTGPSGTVDDDTDCDDTDVNVHPGAAEQCNGADDDCNGTADDGVVYTDWYADADADGYGDDGATPVNDCKAPSGTVANAEDCDDKDATVNPAATEVCDGKDDDCDGVTDPDTSADAPAWYADADGDGFGDPATEVRSCTAPSGYIADGTDCDDADASLGDGADWYADVDRDGYGDGSTSVRACSAPTGYVADGSDCDDNDPSNGDGLDYYADADHDGFGDVTEVVHACAAPADTVANADDCDDTDAKIRPGAPEQCNGVDDDCNGAVDDDVVYVDWYADADGDGYGDAGATPVNDCVAPAGAIDNDGDCDDTDPAVSPAAEEVCNGKDDDCDGETDTDAIAPPLWYADADGDGYGDPTASTAGCEQPEGTVGNGDDCGDDDPDTYPGALELCDGVDNDCNDLVDDDVGDYTWYTDADGDGYGDDASSTVDCLHPAGTVAEGGDCDDASADAHPGADEVWYDGVDEACDGGDDDDQDADGYADADHGGDDCDDVDATIHPGATDTPNDGIDQDCDGRDGFPATSGRDWTGGEDTGVDVTKVTGCGCATGSPATPGTSAVWIALVGFAMTRRQRREGASGRSEN